MALRVQGVEERIERIFSYLRECSTDSSIERPDELMLEAYRWFYQSARYDFKSQGEDDRFNYDLCTLDSFDVLLRGQRVLADNIRIRQARSSDYKKNPHIFGTPATDSAISISPYFDESFEQIPRPFHAQVVSKLKELARTTDRPATAVQREIKRLCKVVNGVPSIEVAPGVRLVTEFETVGVCFLGFLLVSDQRNSVNSQRRSYSSSSPPKVAVFFSSLILVVALVYVPYDVVLVQRGDNVRVFNGYDFVWSAPTITEVCDAHIGKKSFEPYWVHDRCYSQISSSRATLSVLAGLVPLLLVALLAWLNRRKIS